MKFIKLVGQIVNIEDISTVEKYVYIKICNRCDYGLPCWIPSQELPAIKVTLRTRGDELSMTYDTEKERDEAFSEIDKFLIGDRKLQA